MKRSIYFWSENRGVASSFMKKYAPYINSDAFKVVRSETMAPDIKSAWELQILEPFAAFELEKLDDSFRRFCLLTVSRKSTDRDTYIEKTTPPSLTEERSGLDAMDFRVLKIPVMSREKLEAAINKTINTSRFTFGSGAGTSQGAP